MYHSVFGKTKIFEKSNRSITNSTNMYKQLQKWYKKGCGYMAWYGLYGVVYCVVWVIWCGVLCVWVYGTDIWNR